MLNGTLPPHENIFESHEVNQNSANGQAETTVKIDRPIDLNGFDHKGNKSHLSKILQTQERLKAAKSQPITFADPILTQSGRPVIYANTINVIQGQAGVHKSRLAETICSAFLKRPECGFELLGFKAKEGQPFTVCYVDTERNLKEQLPFALQNIQVKAGYQIQDKPKNYDFISLLEIPRADRFKALQEYLDHLRQTANNHVFIVLDVITDCISDFNRTDNSMELVDLMNVTINQHDVTFLCLIHENPNQQKARGHLGTEIMNKASTVIQVSFEKEGDQAESDLVKVRYLKCRNSRKFEPFHVKFCEKTKGLVLASGAEVRAVIQSRTQKADIGQILEHLEVLLGDASMKSADLIPELEREFDTNERTIRKRLKEIIKAEMELHNANADPCFLESSKVGKEVFYRLKPIPTE